MEPVATDCALDDLTGDSEESIPENKKADDCRETGINESPESIDQKLIGQIPMKEKKIQKYIAHVKLSSKSNKQITN